jgi:hypothetical protein
MPAWGSPSSGVRQLEDQNRRLKHIVADLTLGKQILQEVLQKRSEARAPTRDRARADRRLSRERAAGLHHRRVPSGDVLPRRSATGREAAADAVARVGDGSAALRLSALAHLVAGRGGGSTPRRRIGSSPWCSRASTSFCFRIKTNSDA